MDWRKDKKTLQIGLKAESGNMSLWKMGIINLIPPNRGVKKRMLVIENLKITLTLDMANNERIIIEILYFDNWILIDGV